MSAGLLIATAAAQPPAASTARVQPAFRAGVAEISSPTVIALDDGRAVRLQGLDLPASAVRPDGAGDRLARWLRSALVGQRVWLQPESENASDDKVALTATVHLERDAPSINAEALRRGLALLRCRTPEVLAFDALRDAAREAQDERLGLFADTEPRPEEIPYLNGAVLGLHYKLRRQHYRRHIDELADAGFRHLSLLLSTFIEDAEADRIRLDHERTVRDERLIETIRYAKGKGMSVMLLPIVLLEKPRDNDWRGTLRPRDEGRFWLSYDAMLVHYADIAQATGVDILSVGSEFSSLEHRTRAWRRIIAHARGRFTGWLTYSANWDHVHAPRFFAQLDLIGMTAYFSLTHRVDPSRDQLRQAWRAIGARLQRSVGMLGKPVIFTELGYASQDGINRDPWNYVLNVDDVDTAEQADCFAAFVDVAPGLAFLRGAYFYDYFDDGGAEDHTYSPRGKPAMAEWRRWAEAEQSTRTR